MNMVLETQMKLFDPEKVQAADSRFFSTEAYLAHPMTYDLIERLDEIAVMSEQAGQELAALPEDTWQAYHENMRKLHNGTQDKAILHNIGYIQGLLDQKNCYADAASAIHRAGKAVVHEIIAAFDPGFGWINKHPYWVGRTSHGRPVFCTAASEDEIVYFGANDTSKQLDGREANVYDYARLLLDLRTEAETTATH